MMGIFVCGCEWNPATFNVRGQSCLKAHGANTGFTAVLQWAFLQEHHCVADSKDSHWETRISRCISIRHTSTGIRNDHGTFYWHLSVVCFYSWRRNNPRKLLRSHQLDDRPIQTSISNSSQPFWIFPASTLSLYSHIESIIGSGSRRSLSLLVQLSKWAYDIRDRSECFLLNFSHLVSSFLLPQTADIASGIWFSSAISNKQE